MSESKASESSAAPRKRPAPQTGEEIPARAEEAVSPASLIGTSAQPLGRQPPPLTPDGVIQLQRTIGNQAVGRILQRSQPLAVQRTPDEPLNDTQRNALFTMLVSRLGSAETFFSAAAQQVHESIQAEDQARAQLVTLIIGVGITFVVPGLGTGITALVNNIPASASTGVHTAALGIQARAGTIASALGDVAKDRAGGVVQAAVARSPRDVLNAFLEGFAAAKDGIVQRVQTSIQDRTALPDSELWVYVANWDPSLRTVSSYATEIRRKYDQWASQVQALGQQTRRPSAIPHDEPYTTEISAVWAEHSTGAYLVQIRTTHVSVASTMQFVQFINADLKAMALARAATTQNGYIPSIPWDSGRIAGLPATPSANAARR